MGRPIDADKTIEKLDCLFKETNVKCLDFMTIGYNHAVADSIAVVKGQPAIDTVEVVRCQDCTHRPEGTGANHDLKFPDEVCPCQCVDDFWYSWKPNEDWFCASGERG